MTTTAQPTAQLTRLSVGAQKLGLKRSDAFDLITTGVIEGQLIGDRWYFVTERLERYLAEKHRSR